MAAKPATTLFNPSAKLTADQGTPLPNESSYRRLIGRLLYLTTTLLNISFSVQHLSQFVSKPHTTHLQVAHIIFRYLKGDKGILFPASSPLRLHGFADSDWASCPTIKRSVTGYIAFFSNLHSSLGCLRNKVLCQSPQLKQNIGNLIVTTNLQSSLQIILHFMKEVNTLNLIVILLERRFNPSSFTCCPCLPLLNLWTSSLSHLPLPPSILLYPS